MKFYLPLFLCILKIIFVESSEDEGREDDENSADNNETGKKEWPEKTSSSSGFNASNIIRPIKIFSSKDPFWQHPIVHEPPWINLANKFEESHYPFHDPSYPIWLPGGSRPIGKLKKFVTASDENDPSDAQLQLNDVQGSFGDDPSNQQELQYSETKNKENDGNEMDEAEKRQYKAELKAGDMTQLFGTNQHHHQPDNYRSYDLGRRFVPQYPYQRQASQNYLTHDDEDLSLIPKQAPPELVLAIAKETALIQAAQPIDPNENLIKKDSLRTGKYWNSYWKEEVEDPTSALRSHSRSKLNTMAAKLSPGTPIYEYVSKLNKLYPKLLYVINKQNDVD